VRRLGGIAGVDDLAHVVAVDGEDGPAECTPFLVQRFQRHESVHTAAALQSVAVHEHGELIEPVLRGGHRAFPNQPFLQLTVAEHYEYPRRRSPLAGVECESDTRRQPVSERT